MAVCWELSRSDQSAFSNHTEIGFRSAWVRWIVVLNVKSSMRSPIDSCDQHTTDNWGIKIANVEIKHVDVLDGLVVRALAKQAGKPGERSRRAKISHATGELEASTSAKEAADVLNKAPNAIQLRCQYGRLDQWRMSVPPPIVFPMPVDLVDKITDQ